MPDESVIFKRGQSSGMPSTKVPGSLLIQTDTGDMFIDDSTTLRIQIGDSRKLSLSGGTMTGPINMGSQKITNLGTPSENTDAVTKLFVDTAFQTLEGEMATSLSGYLPLKGGTMSGVLNMGGNYIQNLEDPQSDDEAATKGYVDGQVTGLQSSMNTTLGSYLKLSGGTLTGPLVLSGNPTQSNQAANKQYVDDVLADAVGGITGFEVDSNNGAGYASYEALVQAHPTGEVGIFYLVKNSDSSVPNAFDEYFWTGTGYEKAGGFGDVDTSDLATKSELSNKMDKFGSVVKSNDLTTINTDTATIKLIAETQLLIGAGGAAVTTANDRVDLRGDEINFQMGSMSVTAKFSPSEIDFANIPVTNLRIGGTTSVYVGVGSSGNLLLGNGLSTPGSTLSGTVVISNVGTPTQNNDAVNKQYVDSKVKDLNVANNINFGVCTATSSDNYTVSVPTITGDAVVNSYVAILFPNGVPSTTSARVSINGGQTKSISQPYSSTVGVVPSGTNCFALCLFKVTSSTELQFLGSMTSVDEGVIS